MAGWVCGYSEAATMVIGQASWEEGWISGTKILSSMVMLYLFQEKKIFPWFEYYCYQMLVLWLVCAWPPALQSPPKTVSVNLGGTWIFNRLSKGVRYTGHWELWEWSDPYPLLPILISNFIFLYLFSLNIWVPMKSFEVCIWRS